MCMNENPNGPSRIQWTRYWCPRAGEYNLTEDGFLHKDPEYSFISKDAKSLADLADVPCLVLLGSPGMGKTDELTRAQSHDHGPKLFLDLGRLDAALPLREMLSESPEVRQWASGNYPPTLWLDSLDEGVGDISNLARLLEIELGKLKHVLPQLRLRIACRIANWPVSLEQALINLWSGDSCQVYEIMPLRDEDVSQAARHRSIDFEAFLEAVRKAKAGPLAAKPVTLLRMLLPEFQQLGKLPGRQVEVYEKGCKRLAAEWASGRQEKSTSSNDDAETRFVAAQFVAAAMTFYGRNVLDCASERHTGASDAVHSLEIGSTGGMSTEPFAAPSIASVEFVAKTSLMTGAASQHQYRFEHRTFQEFLAAWFLYTQKIPLPKVLTLFLNPSGSDRRAVPQLIETAAWLAALDPKFRGALLEADPVAVLRSDVAAQDDATQQKLFSALCDGLRKGAISDNEWNGRRDLSCLKFNGIASEISAILNDTTQPEQVREFAIDVAWHAKVHEVYNQLADLALDTTRPLREREHCTYALSSAHEESEATLKAKARLEPLLDTTRAEDPNDTLRGNALRALWHTLDPIKLFAALRPHHNPDYIGAYWFAREIIRRGLRAQHVLAGLAWVERQPHASALERDVRQLMSRVLSLAWQNLDQPGVLEALAKTAAIRVSYNEDVRLDDDGEDDYDRYNRGPSDWPNAMASNDPLIVDRRRRLCQAMVWHVAEHQTAAFWLGYYMQCAQPQDFMWLLEQHLAATPHAERKVWLELALHVWRGSGEQVTVVQHMGAQHESIRNAFRELIARLDPESPESIADRESWKQHERELREIQASNAPEPLDPPPAQRIETLLIDLEQGDLGAWWRLWELMRVDEYGRSMHGLYFEPDIRKTPYWQGATPEMRGRLIAVAEKYAKQAQEDPGAWVGKQVIHYPSAAGLSALMLLYHEHRDIFDALAAESWAHWQHIVLDFPNAKQDGVWAELLAAGYKKAPNAFRKAVERLLRTQANSEHGAAVLWRLPPRWDELLCAIVFDVVSKEPCSQAVLTQAFDMLLENGHKPARNWCLAQVDKTAQADAAAPFDSRLEPAITALLRNRPTQDEWTKLWAVLDQPFRKDFALDVFGKERPRRVEMCNELSEGQLADFYIWLRRNAPAVPEHYGMHTVGPAEQLDDLKRIVLNVLMQRGTPAAVEQCERIHAEFNDNWFCRVIIAVKAEARRTGWVPVKPRDLWQYVAKAKSLMARGERELCDAVMDALERINKELQGENPSAPDLWDSNKPKDERHFSNWLTRQLQRELSQAGVFIGREIAVRLRGQTDIQVIAKRMADEPEFGIIIEVKGCWHKEVNTAMETQLRDRYLVKHSYTHGIYVVGWFYCEAWSNKRDSRRKAHPEAFRTQTRKDVQAVFEKQAEDISSGAMNIRAFVLDATLPRLNVQPKTRRDD